MWEAFQDLVPDDPNGPPDPVDPSDKTKGKGKGKDKGGPGPGKAGAGSKEAGEEEGIASEAQAKSAAAKQLLEGQLLAELVGSHMAVMATAATASTAGSPASASASPQPLPRSAEVWLSPGSLVESFRLSYDLGAQLLGWLGGALDGGLDTAALTGHLMRACMECQTLGRAPAATAADAAAGGGPRGGGPRGRKAASAGASASSWLASGAILSLDNGGGNGGDGDPTPTADAGSAAPSGVDINGPCVEEVCLLQAPIATMADRLRALLGEFPEHPVLVSLAAICARCLSLPVTCTLKTALTGLELLLNRAQVGRGMT